MSAIQKKRVNTAIIWKIIDNLDMRYHVYDIALRSGGDTDGLGNIWIYTNLREDSAKNDIENHINEWLSYQWEVRGVRNSKPFIETPKVKMWR